MAFPKVQEGLTEVANEARTDMVEDGTRSELSRTWLGGLDVVDGLQELPDS